MALKQIKLKIISTKKTSTVTRAMEAVSAVKMRKAQERALTSRSYAWTALRILRGLAGSTNLVNHPLTREHAGGKVAIVVITSDKGLAGSLNSAVLKKVENFMREEGLKQSDVVFLCLGKRGYEFAINRGYEVVHHKLNISETIDEQEFHDITDQVIALYQSGIAHEVRIAYTDFISTFEQEAAIHKILPLSEKILEHIVASIRPAKGKFAIPEVSGNDIPAYTIEPDAEDVINALLPRLVNIAVFHKLLESKASEHSARMVAMKSATDKAKEIATLLTRKYNKARQAAITREVSEITSGIEAMR